MLVKIFKICILWGIWNQRLHPKTLNPKPKTLIPKPYTLNPEP